MTAVEKIIALADERYSILAFGKQYRPEEQEKLDRISDKLSDIKRTCPTAWKVAGRILHP